MAENKMSNLEELICGLITVFHNYSKQEGDKYTLTKAELKTLLQKELSDFLTVSNNPEKVDEIMKELDDNQDGVVDFQEFLVLFGVLTIACHKFFKDYNSKSSKK